MPKLKDMTPEHLRCTYGPCESVYDAGEDFVIIGKALTDDQLEQISGKVGHDEYAVRISKAYFQGTGGSG